MEENKKKSPKKPRRGRKEGGPRSIRRKERELALWGIFKLDFEEDGSVKEMMEVFGDDEYGNQLVETSGEYADEVVKAFKENQEAVDEWIAKYIKEGWRMDKLAKTDKAILRLCVTEMLMTPDRVPKEIAINEAIELARKYGESNSTKYINGILNQVAQNALKD